MDSSQDSLIMNLVQRARAGDQAALNELFRNCRDYLGVVAQANVDSWLQAKVDSSDVVQQTLLEAHRGFPKFQGTTEREWLAWFKKNSQPQYRGLHPSLALHRKTSNQSRTLFR